MDPLSLSPTAAGPGSCVLGWGGLGHQTPPYHRAESLALVDVFSCCVFMGSYCVFIVCLSAHCCLFTEP